MMFAPLIFILSAFLAATNGEVLDFATLYRFSRENYSLTVTKEYHRQTNALGMLLQKGNDVYDYIDSVQGMSSLSCAGAGWNCIWNKEGEWSVQNTTMNEDFKVSIPLDVARGSGDEDSCSINNGGCQVFCIMRSGQPTCSCPSYFSLLGKNCYPDNPTYRIFTNASGKFEYGARYIGVLIIAPVNTTIELNITIENSRILYILDYNPERNQRKTLSYSLRNIHLLSTSHIVYIYTERDHYSNSYDIRIAGEFGVRLPTLILESASGALSLSVPPLAPAMCVSVIYRPASDEHVRMTATLPSSSQLDFAESYTKAIGSWLISRFEVSLPEYDTHSPVLLSAHVSGVGTMIYSIAGCSPYGKVDITVVGRVPLTALPTVGGTEGTESNADTEQKCYNGGIYVEDSEQCDCPAGFMGQRCEEGCGTNGFGSDCEGVCSHFAEACSGIVFCKPRHPCQCAPGYRGRYCDDGCSHGHYGASCQRTCGKCFNGTCNVYTGTCAYGCLPGYYPPLCQDTYRYIDSAPRIVNKDFTWVTLKSNVTIAKGRGNVNFYQVQYRVQGSGKWLEVQPEKVTDPLVSTNLTRLRAGRNYEVRIVLIDQDGNSYDGEKVAVGNFTTLCTVPSTEEYDLKILRTTNDSCVASWKYESGENECPITGYELVLQKDWQRIKRALAAESSETEFEELLPGELYSLTVRALTQRGPAPVSPPLAVGTRSSAPDGVIDLRISRHGSTGLDVSWQKPPYTAGEVQDYVVKYECVRLLACPEGPCGALAPECADPCALSHGSVTAAQPPAALQGLLAHAQYRLSVRARAGELGPPATAHATTPDSGPAAPPQPADPPEAGLEATNSSVTVSWRPPRGCAQLGGYLRGYRLQLRRSGEQGAPLRDATTAATSATFDGLQPRTEYSVRVFAETSGGWSPQHGLEIAAATAATAPEAVRGLEVYKRGRRTLGLRWAAPDRSYGPLSSFSVSLSRDGPQPGTEAPLLTASVPLTERCTAWPGLFCHTVRGPPLSPGQRYRVTVRARNQLVDAEGLPATALADTVETAPGRPLALSAEPRGPRAVRLRWQPPQLFNGQLRSFLLTVEQTDALEAASCCADFPVRELPVRAELPAYEFEVTELSPAGSYVFSVSAKTLAIGPGASVSASTGPELPALQPPQLRSWGERGPLLALAPAAGLPELDTGSGLDGAYLLLVLPAQAEEEEAEGETERTKAEPEGEALRPGAVLSPQLAEQLAAAADNASFYVAREFPLGELPAEVQLGAESELLPEDMWGQLAELTDPPLQPGAEYRAGLALVLRYRGAASVALAAGEPFVVPDRL